MGWDQRILVTDPTTGRKKWQRRKRPAKGLRKYIRRKKMFERQQAFEALMAEQRRKNFQLDEAGRKQQRRARAQTEEIQNLLPDDDIGRLIRTVINKPCPKRTDRLNWHHQTPMREAWAARCGDPPHRLPATLGELHRLFIKFAEFHKDEVWKWAHHEYKKATNFAWEEDEVMREIHWHGMARKAEVAYGVTMPSYPAMSSPTLLDFHRILKAEIGNKAAPRQVRPMLRTNSLAGDLVTY